MRINRCFGCMEEVTAIPCPHCGYFPGSGDLGYALRPGTILNGKYLLGKVLGQGGFGITYIGWDLYLQRKVAIKEYYPSGSVSRLNGTCAIKSYATEAAQTALSEGQIMFLKEARKMSKVSAVEQVVQVLDLFQENGTAYICMEFVDGETLKHYLKKKGPLSWNEAERIFRPVMEAMRLVHSEGLIHRDLSPDNLMLQPNGGIKILDLGAAKDVTLNSGASSMQVAKGGFSPLEQYVQHGSSGTWTDVYSLAATMYYTVTGVVPPTAIDRMDRDTIDWTLPGIRNLPDSVLRAVQRAMALRAEERTQTIGEFAAELEGEQKQASKKKSKYLVPGVAAAVLAICISAVAGGVFGSKADLFGQAEIEKLIAAGTQDVYTYRNGARMELYYDQEGRERCRIFENPQGDEEFRFTANYDDEGRVLEKRGYEGENLMRTAVWTRNSDGNTTEYKIVDAEGKLLNKTEIRYDNQGRETFRTTTDRDGNITLSATSEYDATGMCTYSGERADGEWFVQTYDADGNILESITRDAEGNLIYHGVSNYDSSGRETEYLSYDGEGNLSYRQEYKYTGDLLTATISHSYFGDEEYISEYRVIYGPGNTRFGEQDMDNTYGGISERVEAMGGTWMVRGYDTRNDENGISYYNWDGDYIYSETFNSDGELYRKSEEHYNEAGENTGSTSTVYNSDETYSVTEYDASYQMLFTNTYSSADKLLEECEYHYDASGNMTGITYTTYHDDGSRTVEKDNADYRTVSSATYDASGSLVSITDYYYNSVGMRDGSTSTYYYYDGSYTVVEEDASYRTVSRKTYDANGKLIKSE